MAFTNDDIAMIGVRYSEDSRTRTDNDDVYFDRRIGSEHTGHYPHEERMDWET